MFCNYLCKWNIAFFTNDRHLPISNINILIILRGHVLKWNVKHPYLKVFVLHRHLLNHVYKILEQYFYGIFKTMSIRYGDLFHKHFHTDYLFDFQLSAIFFFATRCIKSFDYCIQIAIKCNLCLSNNI